MTAYWISAQPVLEELPSGAPECQAVLHGRVKPCSSEGDVNSKAMATRRNKNVVSANLSKTARDEVALVFDVHDVQAISHREALSPQPLNPVGIE